MKTLAITGIDKKKAEKVLATLQQFLADYQVYYTNLRGYHWNIKGSSFFTLHAQFEEMYDDAAEKVDEIAERILMLGGTPEHNFSKYLKVSHLKESGVVSSADDCVKEILEAIKHLIKEERSIKQTAEEAGDDVTAAMMDDYLSEQEKLAWMLSAYLA